jgi:DNA-binding HxlR family transcriptional regulator
LGARWYTSSIMGSEDYISCPAYTAIEALQEKWVLHIIGVLLEGSRGFNELSRAIGCNPATLAQRLDRLEALGIVKKTVHSVMPPRTEYELSPAGLALEEVIGAIDRWSREHLGTASNRGRVAS